MQPAFESELHKNLDVFKQDKIEYVSEYRTAGPMQPGLTPREASDKLILFQVRTTCLFPPTRTFKPSYVLESV